MNPPNKHILKAMSEAGAVPVRDLEITEDGHTRNVSVWRVWMDECVPPLLLVVEGESWSDIPAITNTVKWYLDRVESMIDEVKGQTASCYIEVELLLNAARSGVVSKKLVVRARTDLDFWENVERGFLQYSWWPPPADPVQNTETPVKPA